MNERLIYKDVAVSLLYYTGLGGIFNLKLASVSAEIVNFKADGAQLWSLLLDLVPPVVHSSNAFLPSYEEEAPKSHRGSIARLHPQLTSCSDSREEGHKISE